MPACKLIKSLCVEGKDFVRSNRVRSVRKCAKWQGVCVCGGGGEREEREEKRGKSEDEKARENIEKRACNR